MAHTLLTLEGCSHHAKVQMAGSDSPPNRLLLFWVGLWVMTFVLDLRAKSHCSTKGAFKDAGPANLLKRVLVADLPGSPSHFLTPVFSTA
jgi:hypothetical protein